jgi:hypothetical protein
MSTGEKQRDIFLRSEADAWFERSQQALAARDFSRDDAVVGGIQEISSTPIAGQVPLRLLEIGCGEGNRLSWLAMHLGGTVCETQEGLSRCLLA